jgi:acyl-CoA reductase-like NAD-dependent aldehyde dehydrogenase
MPLRPLRPLHLRQFSTGIPVGSNFPLALPKGFNYNSGSVVYSDGKSVTPQSSENAVPVHNPATEELLQSIDCASPETVKAAIADAGNIFKSGQWSRAQPTERFKVLNKISSLLRQQNKELAACTPLENGLRKWRHYRLADQYER